MGQERVGTLKEAKGRAQREVVGWGGFVKEKWDIIRDVNE